MTADTPASPQFVYLGAPGIQYLADAIRWDDMSWLTTSHLETAVQDFDWLLEARNNLRAEVHVLREQVQTFRSLIGDALVEVTGDEYEEDDRDR